MYGYELFSGSPAWAKVAFYPGGKNDHLVCVSTVMRMHLISEECQNWDSCLNITSNLITVSTCHEDATL